MALHKGTSFPVGKVDFMDLYPLTFQEFLCALGEERFVNILQGTDTDMVTTFKSKYIDRLREYYYVGGMPEVVQTYVETKDFNQVRQIQKNLLNYYQQDFSKHAKTSLVPRLNLVWNSIPMQLAKKNKKYIELTDTGKKYYDYYNELYEGIKNYFSSKGINDSGDNYVWLFISKINEEDIKKLIRKA